jgi:hypothetical protein
LSFPNKFKTICQVLTNHYFAGLLGRPVRKFWLSVGPSELPVYGSGEISNAVLEV